MSLIQFWLAVLFVFPREFQRSIVIGVEFWVNLDIVTILGIMDSWDMRPLPENDSATASRTRLITDLQPTMQVEPNPM
jgi:hypothetical protein